MVCIGVNTRSGRSFLTCSATSGSRMLVGELTSCHGNGGSSSSCRWSLTSMVSGCRLASSATMPAVKRLMPSWCPMRT